MKRTVGADDLGVVGTWVDASYATHEDMKSHTRGIFPWDMELLTINL